MLDKKILRKYFSLLQLINATNLKNKSRMRQWLLPKHIFCYNVHPRQIMKSFTLILFVAKFKKAENYQFIKSKNLKKPV